MSYVYIKSERAGHQGAEHDLFTVGFYEPDGKWQPDSDHMDENKAAERVHYLNGGKVTVASEKPATVPAGLVLVSRSFLEATPCPNKQCSGGFITSTGPDPEHEPCQWCEARDRMLNGEVPLL